MFAVSHLVVIEPESLAAAQNANLLGAGKFLEPSGIAQRFEHSNAPNERKGARAPHFTIDIVFLASDFLDEDVHIRIVDDFRQHLGDNLGQLHWSLTGSLRLANQGNRDLAIRADYRKKREI